MPERFELVNIAPHIKAAEAAVQFVMTTADARSRDWETRYLAEGVADLETLANIQRQEVSEDVAVDSQ